MQNNLLNEWGQAVLNPLQDIWYRFLVFLPNLIGALLILLIGWIVAIGLDRLVTQILKQLKLDHALNKVGTKTLFKKSGVDFEASDFIGGLVKWTILLIAFLAAADILGLTKITDFLNAILSYVPNIFVAIAILLIGMLAANFFAHVVRGGVGAARIRVAHFLATITKWTIWIFAILAALGQLGIAETIIDRLITAIFFMLALAGGLAFGLGGQKAASDALDDMKKEIKHRD
jgi:small-conductance mechanosensitive channel